MPSPAGGSSSGGRGGGGGGDVGRATLGRPPEVILVGDLAALHQVRNLCREPGAEAQAERVCQAEVRGVLGPERLKVYRQADLPAAVHLGRLTLQLRKLQLGGGGRVRRRDLELEVELVFQEVVHVPALALPCRPLLVLRAEGEPVTVLLLVDLNVLDERRVLLNPPPPARARARIAHAAALSGTFHDTPFPLPLHPRRGPARSYGARCQAGDGQDTAEGEEGGGEGGGGGASI